MPRHRRCETCEFWEGLGSEGQRGVCMRYPPTTEGWPESYIHDWCGEWRSPSTPDKETPDGRSQ